MSWITSIAQGIEKAPPWKRLDRVSKKHLVVFAQH